jgi:hypothetical protein
MEQWGITWQGILKGVAAVAADNAEVEETDFL